MVRMPWLKMRLALALAGLPGMAVAATGCGGGGGKVAAPVDTTPPIGNTVEEGDPVLTPDFPPLRADQWCGTPQETIGRFGDQGSGSECPVTVWADGYRWARDQDTSELRSDGSGETVCCFTRDPNVIQPTRGRPLMVDGYVRLATGERAGAWVPDELSEPLIAGDLSLAAREDIARRGVDNGLVEHASVASFARATLELMAVGAPPSLIAAVQRATADEIRHAQMCFAIASSYAGTSVGPGLLPAAAPRGLDLDRLAAATFVEGCVPESVGALEADLLSRRASSPAVRRMLSEIAEDETRHAELAWATVGWAARTGGQPVIDAVVAAARAFEVHTAAASSPFDELLGAHGLMSDGERAELTVRSWRGVVEPLVAGLVADLAMPAGSREIA